MNFMILKNINMAKNYRLIDFSYASRDQKTPMNSNGLFKKTVYERQNKYLGMNAIIIDVKNSLNRRS